MTVSGPRSLPPVGNARRTGSTNLKGPSRLIPDAEARRRGRGTLAIVGSDIVSYFQLVLPPSQRCRRPI